MTPEAKKQCEKLARKYSGMEATDTDVALWSELNKSFKIGFQAGYSYNEEKLRVAVEVLESISAFHLSDEQIQTLGKECAYDTKLAREALAKIRGENEPKK